MQNRKRADGSWFPISPGSDGFRAVERPDFGAALFQMSLSAIDARPAALPVDVIVALGFLAGRAAQQFFLRDDAGNFQLEQARNGGLLLLNDNVSAMLSDLEQGTLAAILTQQVMQTGTDRFPWFNLVRVQAREAMDRHGRADLRGLKTSAHPQELASQIQAQFDHVFMEAEDRQIIVRSVFVACAKAISYSRDHVRPTDGAELAMSVALYASWLDRRQSPR